MAEGDIPQALARKLVRVKDSLAESAGFLVAFSGGVDSSLLLAVAARTRGAEGLLAVTVHSALQPIDEVDVARKVALELGVRHEVLELDPLRDEKLRANPPERCYLCKHHIFESLLAMAKERGLEAVVEGTNADDDDDFRPGRRALAELGIRSPLREAGLIKSEIRALARALEVTTWDRPSLACMASRIPYGEELTDERLRRVDDSEALIRSLGISQVRVRDHGNTARIEVPPDAIARLADPSVRVREKVIEGLRALGYRYVSLDLEGYRTGAMNEVLSEQRKREIEKGE